MSASIGIAAVEEVGSMGLQDHPLAEDWEEADEAELESFITADQQVIPSIVSAIHSSDRHTRLIATTKIRRLLHILPPQVGLQPVIDSGLVPTVVEMLSSEDTRFRAEAAWIVSNIASGTSEQTSTVVNAGAIPKLVAMFPTHDSDTDVQKYGLWALGNIGGDSKRFRDMILNAGGVKPVLDVLDTPEYYTEAVRNTASWVLACYLTARPGPDLGLEVTGPMIPIITKFLRGPNYISWETMGYAVEALAKICDNPAAAEPIMATGILPRLVELCIKGHSKLQIDAMRCVGQFTAGSEASTDAAIGAGFLDAAKACIGHRNAIIRESACWAASNVAAGSLPQVHALLNAGLLPILVAVASDKHEVSKPRSDATWALANLVHAAVAHPEFVDPLIEGQCIKAFSDATTSQYLKTQSIAVQSLQRLLTIAPRSQDKIVESLKATDGIARLRAVRDGRNTRGSEAGRTAHWILKDHFPDFVKRARV